MVNNSLFCYKLKKKLNKIQFNFYSWILCIHFMFYDFYDFFLTENEIDIEVERELVVI